MINKYVHNWICCVIKERQKSNKVVKRYLLFVNQFFFRYVKANLLTWERFNKHYLAFSVVSFQHLHTYIDASIEKPATLKIYLELLHDFPNELHINVYFYIDSTFICACCNFCIGFIPKSLHHFLCYKPSKRHF